MLVAGCEHECVLEFAGQPTDIENSIATHRALEVDRRHVHSGTEEKIRGSRVAMQPDLLILPHPVSTAPDVTQPGKLLDIPLPDTPAVVQPVDDAIEITADRLEVYRHPAYGAVVLSRQEIGERLEAGE